MSDQSCSRYSIFLTDFACEPDVKTCTFPRIILKVTPPTGLWFEVKLLNTSIEKALSHVFDQDTPMDITYYDVDLPGTPVTLCEKSLHTISESDFALEPTLFVKGTPKAKFWKR